MVEQCFQHHLALEAGQRGAKAEVDARGEREQRHLVASDIEAVGVVHHGWVAVCGSEQQQHSVALRYDVATALGVGADEAGVELHRRFEAQHLLHRRRHQGAVGPQPGELVGVAHQGQDDVADQNRGRLEARCVNEQDHEGHFLLAEPVAVVARHDQPRQQIVGWFGPPPVDQIVEVFDHFGLRRRGLHGFPRRGVRLKQSGHVGHQRPEPVPIGQRHPNEFADHVGGQQEGKLLDQLALARFGNGGEQLVGHGPDRRPQTLHPVGTERPADL